MPIYILVAANGGEILSSFRGRGRIRRRMSHRGRLQQVPLSDNK